VRDRQAGLQTIAEKPNAAAAAGDKPAIAVLLIVIDSVPFEDMWRAWAEHGKDCARVDFFIHAKHPERVQSEWARRRLVPKSFRPTWGSVQITMAMHYLLCQAYKHEVKVRCVPVLNSVVSCARLLMSCVCGSMGILCSRRRPACLCGLWSNACDYSGKPAAAG
jgi:hypothetical protein